MDDDEEIHLDGTIFVDVVAAVVAVVLFFISSLMNLHDNDGELSISNPMINISVPPDVGPDRGRTSTIIA
jgi:hypothetical protein